LNAPHVDRGGGNSIASGHGVWPASDDDAELIRPCLSLIR
jgi:hypothetical protein